MSGFFNTSQQKNSSDKIKNNFLKIELPGMLLTRYFNNNLLFKFIGIILILGSTLYLFSCNKTEIPHKVFHDKSNRDFISHSNRKVIIYQVLPRLFGNTNQTNKPWGTIEKNGVGKFNDFTEVALKAIKQKGVGYIWFTGILHHDVIRDYRQYGISNDDPDVVKGRAGSPYAIKDYYNVDPDLADDPANRLDEFKALIKRTHQQGMKVIIDIVPNHVARNYHSISAPNGVRDFGVDDDKTVPYKRDNNFYYIPGEDFKVPQGLIEKVSDNNLVLNDNFFKESPAKWTGNNVRKSQPDVSDWYETVKINFGVSPDGKKDFPLIPSNYKTKNAAAHYSFWKGKSVPDSWGKFRNIVLFWLDQGVDGFRYDMAEMVPVEFWSYLNSAIKHKNNQAFLLAEIYNPAIYRDYIYLGKMDAIYDKVGFYDTIREIVKGEKSADALVEVENSVKDIEQHMLHFLENHDEQRVANGAFANCKQNCAERVLPAMVVSTLINSGPTLLYFAQDVGEKAEKDAGAGKASRTTIKDYWGVPAHQRWMNHGLFDGGKLSKKQKSLLHYYSRLLNYAASSEAVMGEYEEIQTINRRMTHSYSERLFSFVRWKDSEKIIVLSNFDVVQSYEISLLIPAEVIERWNLSEGHYSLKDKLNPKINFELIVKNSQGRIKLKIKPLASFILQLQQKEL